MNTIKELLSHYDLSLDQCNDEWREMVENFQRVQSALPANIAQAKEKAIVDEFEKYHEVTNEETPSPPAQKEKKIKTKKGKQGKSIPMVAHTYDEQSIFDKAEKVIKNLF
jgi:hypothetical protein